MHGSGHHAGRTPQTQLHGGQQCQYSTCSHPLPANEHHDDSSCRAMLCVAALPVTHHRGCAVQSGPLGARGCSMTAPPPESIAACCSYLIKGRPDGVAATYVSCCAPKNCLSVQSSYAMRCLKNLQDCVPNAALWTQLRYSQMGSRPCNVLHRHAPVRDTGAQRLEAGWVQKPVTYWMFP